MLDRDQATLGTSAVGAMRAQALPLVIIVAGAMGLSGTSSASADTLWMGTHETSTSAHNSSNAGLSVTKESSFSPTPQRARFETPAAVLMTIRRLSGLTWEQLSRALGVARRSLHFWAGGKPVSSTNHERLGRMLAVLHEVDRGSARANRTLLLTAVESGEVALDLLAEQRFEETIALLGRGEASERRLVAPAGIGAARAKFPARPAELVDALTDRIHREPGKARGARTARVRE